MSKKKLKKPKHKKVRNDNNRVIQRSMVNSESQKSVSTGKLAIWAVVVLVFTFIAYSPALKNEWTNLDDDKYVLLNEDIKTVDVAHFFSTPHDGNYHPLTMISLAIDYQISGFEPWMYHITNIIFHLLTTLVVFWLSFLLGKQFFARHRLEFAVVLGLLFGLHTLHVESVAWVSERKDVLYAFFFFLSLVLYVKYIDERKTKFFVLSLVFFVLSTLSKGMAVSLSLSVIALDYLYGRQLLNKKVIIEKIPFLAISLIFGLLAVWAQRNQGYIHQTDVYDMGQRIVFASYGYVNYLLKLVFPYPLSAIYPYPLQLGKPPVPQEFYLYIFPVLVIIFLFFYFWKRNRFITFTILFFTVNIIFVLQLLPVGGVIMSDRYTYVPSFGFFFLLAYGGVWLYGKRIKWLPTLVFALYLPILSFLTFERTQVWKNSFTLWDNVLGQYPKVVSAWYNLGVAHHDIQEYDLAIRAFDRAVALRPDYIDAVYNRGNAKFYKGDFQGAVNDYTLALQVNPNYLNALYNRGIARIKIQDFEGAEKDCTQAINLKGDYSEAYFNRGISRINQGKNELAVTDFDQALKYNPSLHNSYLFRGIAKSRSGSISQGCADINQAVALGVPEAKDAQDKYCQ